MRAVIKKIFVIAVSLQLILPSHHSLAQDGAGQTAIVIGAVAGAAIVAGAAHEGWLSFELIDWKQQDTDSTAHLIKQCEQTVELRLLGNNPANYIYFAANNESSQTKIFNVNDIKVIFDNGIERLASWGDRVDPIKRSKNQKIIAAIPLANKEDFRDVNKIEIQISVNSEDGKSTCTIKTALNRDPNVPRDFRTTRDATSFELSLGFGAPVTRTDGLGNLTNSGVYFDMVMYGFPKIHHGLNFGLSIVGYTNSSPTLMAAVTGSTTLNPYLYYYSFSLGYTFRYQFFKWMTASWDIAPALALARHDVTSGSRSAYYAYVYFLERLNLDFQIYKGRGMWQGAVTLGVSALHEWLPSYVSLGSVPFSGHSIGILGRLKIGL